MGIVIGRLDNAPDHGAFVVYVISKNISRLGLEDRVHLLWREGKRSVSGEVEGCGSESWE